METEETYLESFLQDLLGFGTTDSAMDSNLFVSADTKGSHSVAGCKIRGVERERDRDNNNC